MKPHLPQASLDSLSSPNLSKNKLVDTHCHLPQDAEELRGIIDYATGCGIEAMVSIGTGKSLEEIRQSVTLAEEYPQIWSSVGIHPIEANAPIDRKVLEELVKHHRVIAIGECGLDYYWKEVPPDVQEEAFRYCISLARTHKKPLIIHCREAVEDTLRILKEEKAETIGGVFHCFAGDRAYAERVFELNFLVSLTGILTFKSSNALRELVKELPLSKIMLETDSPYMAPEPYRGQKAQPGHVLEIAKKLAQVKDISLEEVALQTSNNAMDFFKKEFFKVDLF